MEGVTSVEEGDRLACVLDRNIFDPPLHYCMKGTTALNNPFYAQSCVHITKQEYANLSKTFINYGHTWVNNSVILACYLFLPHASLVSIDDNESAFGGEDGDNYLSGAMR